MSDLTRGLKALDDARPAYVLARKMFKGTAREIVANEAIRTVIEASGAKYRANFARKAVKSRTNRLKVASLTVADDESKGLTKRLQDDIAKPNDFIVELPRFIEKVCVFGDAYLLRWPSPKADLLADGTAAKVDVFVRDPLQMRAIYDRENEREIEYVIDCWCIGEGEQERTRVNLYYDDHLEQLVSIDRLKEGAAYTDALFQPWTGDADTEDANYSADTAHIITYEHGLPIEHGRTERPYGQPEHYDAYGPQNAITKIMATHLSGIDWNGWPYRYQLAEVNTKGASLADWGDGDTRQAPGAPTVVRPGQAPVRRSGRLSAAPGTMNKLSNVRAVGQLDGSPANVFLDPLVAYIRVLGETTDTPMNVTDPTGQVESGQSRMARIDDLLSRVESLKDQLAGPIAAICEGALALLGEPDRTVTVTWAPSSKVSDTEGWLAVKAKQDAGVPERVALIEAGYLPEQVDEWAEQLDGKLTAIERIAAVGLALGQASAVMGLPAELANEIFGKFILEVLGPEDAADIERLLAEGAPGEPPAPPAAG